MTTKPLSPQLEKSAAQNGGLPRWFNQLMAWVLRSPLHRLISGSVMLITFTGRKSGKVYSTPISYTRQGGQIIAFTHSNWWKNLQGGAPVTLWVAGKEIQGVAEAVAGDATAILPYLRSHLGQVTRDARFFAVKLDANGRPVEADLAQAAQQSILLRITPTTTPKE